MALFPEEAWAAVDVLITRMLRNKDIVRYAYGTYGLPGALQDPGNSDQNNIQPDDLPFNARDFVIDTLGKHRVLPRSKLLEGGGPQFAGSVHSQLVKLLKAGILIRPIPGYYCLSSAELSKKELDEIKASKRRAAESNMAYDYGFNMDPDLQYKITKALSEAMTSKEVATEVGVSERHAQKIMREMCRMKLIHRVEVSGASDMSVRMSHLYATDKKKLDERRRELELQPNKEILRFLSNIPDMGWANLYDAAHADGTPIRKIQRQVEEMLSKGLIELGRIASTDLVRKTPEGSAIMTAAPPSAPEVRLVGVIGEGLAHVLEVLSALGETKTRDLVLISKAFAPRYTSEIASISRELLKQHLIVSQVLPGSSIAIQLTEEGRKTFEFISTEIIPKSKNDFLAAISDQESRIRNEQSNEWEPVQYARAILDVVAALGAASAVDVFDYAAAPLESSCQAADIMDRLYLEEFLNKLQVNRNPVLTTYTLKKKAMEHLASKKEKP